MKIELYEGQPEREARLVREVRQAQRKAQPIDPLRKRMLVANTWCKFNETNPHYGLVHVNALYRNAGFRPYVLPRLQAFLTAREKAKKQAYSDQLRGEAQIRGYLAALKKAAPLSLFREAA